MSELLCYCFYTYPWILVTMAEPRPWVHDTLMPPTSEQTEMYGSMVFLPHLGAT